MALKEGAGKREKVNKTKKIEMGEDELVKREGMKVRLVLKEESRLAKRDREDKDH